MVRAVENLAGVSRRTGFGCEDFGGDDEDGQCRRGERGEGRLLRLMLVVGGWWLGTMMTWSGICRRERRVVGFVLGIAIGRKTRELVSLNRRRPMFKILIRDLCLKS